MEDAERWTLTSRENERDEKAVLKMVALSGFREGVSFGR